MSKTLEQVRELVARREVLVSVHGHEELTADNIHVRDVIEGLATAILVEDYPDYAKVPVSLYFSEMEWISHFMYCGVFPLAKLPQRF